MNGDREMVVSSGDITDAGELGRRILQSRSTEEVRKFLVLPRTRSITLENVGWWLVGVLGALAISGVLAVAYWSQTRTIKETLEGGWTRTVIDYSVSYVAIFAPVGAITVLLWTLVFVAYRLVADNS